MLAVSGLREADVRKVAGEVGLAQFDLESTGRTQVAVRAMSGDRLEDTVYWVRRAHGR